MSNSKTDFGGRASRNYTIAAFNRLLAEERTLGVENIDKVIPYNTV